MTAYYADSSALVKRYVNETGSDWVRTTCSPSASHVIALAHIGLVEIAAALAMKTRQGALPADVRDNLLRDVQRDARSQYWLIDVDQAIVVRPMALSRLHKVRGYDAVHLACALFMQEALLRQNLPAPVLLTAGGELLAAAQAEGLLTDNPNLRA